MACSKYNFKQSCYLQNMIATFGLKTNLQKRQKTHKAWVFHASVFIHVYLVTLKNIISKFASQTMILCTMFTKSILL